MTNSTIKLNLIIKNVLEDNNINYGGYGNKELWIKRKLWWERFKIATKIYNKHCRKFNHNNLLDFGCQFAFVSAALSDEFKNIYLVEIYQDILNFGVNFHKKFGNNNFIPIMNQKDNPNEYIKHIDRNNKIDLFLMFDVLEHIPNIDSFLSHIRLISSKNSYLLISLPTENFFYMLLTKFKREPGHCNRYFEIERKLKSLNCKLIEKKTILFLFNIYLFKL